MKKIIFIILSALALQVFVGCNDMLEEQNFGNPTVEEMMQNEENVVLMVGQAYADVKWVHDHWGYWGVSSLTADECVCPVREPRDDWEDGGYWKNLNTHNWNPLADAFKNIWNTTISGAVLCNKLIGTLDSYKDVMGEHVYNQYVGELEVLRSYYYYLLFDCFGRIPYLEGFNAEPEPLMQPSEVWSNLVLCLEKNAVNLPQVTDGNRAVNYGRVTQGFAYSLLARLYLNAESYDCTVENILPEVKEKFKIASNKDFYTNAVRCCDEVINSHSYKIEDNFFNNFKIKNELSKENIFVIVENGDAEFDNRSYPGTIMSNKLRIHSLTLTYPMKETWNLKELPWNGFCARPGFIERYADTDVRGCGNEGNGTKNIKQWGWFVGPVYDSKGKSIMDYASANDRETKAVISKSIESLDGAKNSDGARLFKYEVDKTGTYAWSENDFVLLRYADVLWMKEEAILRGGQGVSGVDTPDFQRMLTRSFAYDADPKAAFAKAYPDLTSLDEGDLENNSILDERGREFAWEMVRRRDLIRFGKFNDQKYVDYVTNTDPLRKWFPIPYSVIEKSHRDENGNPIWTQWPCYGK